MANVINAKQKTGNIIKYYSQISKNLKPRIITLTQIISIIYGGLDGGHVIA